MSCCSVTALPSSDRGLVTSFAAGAGSFPLVGTPERIVADMQKLAEIGFSGVAATFVNYLEELPYFFEKVLPLMREAGLREN